MSLLSAIFKKAASLVPAPVVNRLGLDYFNHRFNAFGTMTTLQIDSANHRATFDLELKGETQPLRVTIARYELTTAPNGGTFIEIHEVTTSREWMTLLAQQMVKGRKFEVPAMLASVL